MTQCVRLFTESEGLNMDQPTKSELLKKYRELKEQIRKVEKQLLDHHHLVWVAHLGWVTIPRDGELK